MFEPKTIDTTIAQLSLLPVHSNENEWLKQLVEIIRECGNFYFVSLYLVEPAGEWAVFRVGTGKFGELMLSRGHRLRVGSPSLVGSSIFSNKIQFLNYHIEEIFLSPYLPDSQWEVSLPLRVQEQVIGALEIEGSEKATFTIDNIEPFQKVADEVAKKLTLSR